MLLSSSNWDLLDFISIAVDGGIAEVVLSTRRDI